MKPSELKSLIIGSLDEKADPQITARKLEEEGVSFDFSKGFSDKVIDRISSASDTISTEIEFAKSMRFAFNRIAITGVAAIVFLLISIFLADGSLSLNSFLGIENTFDEDIVCLLTGN
ncbi:MAG: hypothetical protein NT092_08680 [Bacteroidia bacterium]|nr:hypothetical protein [Bacteroidia bacterium]